MECLFPNSLLSTPAAVVIVLVGISTENFVVEECT